MIHPDMMLMAIMLLVVLSAVVTVAAIRGDQQRGKIDE